MMVIKIVQIQLLIVLLVKVHKNVKLVLKTITEFMENAFLNVQVIHFCKMKNVKDVKFIIKIALSVTKLIVINTKNNFTYNKINVKTVNSLLIIVKAVMPQNALLALVDKC